MVRRDELRGLGYTDKQASFEYDVRIERTWVAHCTMVEQHGEWVLREVHIEPLRPGTPRSGISGSWVKHRLSPAQLLAEGRKQLQPQLAHLAADPDWVAAADAWWGQVRPRRPGRKGHPDGFYAVVALDYERIWTGGSRRPIADLARERRKYAPTVAQWVNEARRRRLLSRAPGRGKPGGHATQQAHRLATAVVGTPENSPGAAATARGMTPKR